MITWQVTPQQQQEIFEPAPAGVRKIVLTTNIAEASITVEGTEFVIDSARAKEVSYDPYLKAREPRASFRRAIFRWVRLPPLGSPRPGYS